jgi:hypothetical protein
MWPDSIVMSSPCLNQDLVFGKAVEDFAVKQLIAQAAVERFTGDMNTGGADRGCSLPHPHNKNTGSRIFGVLIWAALLTSR